MPSKRQIQTALATLRLRQEALDEAIRAVELILKTPAPLMMPPRKPRADQAA
jgi:hypothetical protein